MSALCIFNNILCDLSNLFDVERFLNILFLLYIHFGINLQPMFLLKSVKLNVGPYFIIFNVFT